jgi:hypothetical protein
MAGMHHAKLQEAKEKLTANPQQVNQLKSMVGQTHEFPVADLTNNPTTPFQTV